MTCKIKDLILSGFKQARSFIKTGLVFTVFRAHPSKSQIHKIWTFSRCLIELFGVFFLIGMLNFGGGYAVMPFLQRELVEKRKWLTESEIIDYFVIAQCLPGLILINTATFVGYRKARFAGAIAATAGMVVPAVTAAFLISIVLFQYMSLAPVESTLRVINVSVIILISIALMQFLRNSVTDKVTGGVFFGAFALSFYFSPVWIILGAGIFGVVFRKLRGELA